MQQLKPVKPKVVVKQDLTESLLPQRPVIEDVPSKIAIDAQKYNVPIPTFNPVGMRFSGQSRSRNTAVKPSVDTDDKDKVDEKRN